MRDGQEIMTGGLGADLRALRKSRGITLTQMSDRLGRSVGWISQVERDLSAPCSDDLQAMARVFDVPLSMFFAQSQAAPSEKGVIVRPHTRRHIGKGIAGLDEQLLSPDLTDDFEVVHSTFHPGSRQETMVVRPTQEVGFMLSGKLDLQIDGKDFTVSTGDSFRIRGEAFQWFNPYEQAAVAIWVIAPPVY